MGLNGAVALTANEMDKSANELDRIGKLDVILETLVKFLY